MPNQVILFNNALVDHNPKPDLHNSVLDSVYWQEFSFLEGYSYGRPGYEDQFFSILIYTQSRKLELIEGNINYT